MIDELEWKTRRDRINTKLKALKPAWKIIKYKPESAGEILGIGLLDHIIFNTIIV